MFQYNHINYFLYRFHITYCHCSFTKVVCVHLSFKILQFMYVIIFRIVFVFFNPGEPKEYIYICLIALYDTFKCFAIQINFNSFYFYNGFILYFYCIYSLLWFKDKCERFTGWLLHYSYSFKQICICLH